MPKYPKEFREEALAHMKEVGITQACKDLKVSRCTLNRWCHMQDGIPADAGTEEDTSDQALVIPPETTNVPLPSTPSFPAEEPSAPSDSVATAMSMLVIENMELRATIRQLRSTISGLTDHLL